MINWPDRNYWKEKYTIDSSQAKFAINGISSIGNPKNNSVIFSKGLDEQFLNNLSSIHGSIIITKPEFQELVSTLTVSNGFLFDEDPRYRFAEILEPFWTPRSLRGSLTWNEQYQLYIGKNVTIHPSAYIEPNVIIGDNSIIWEGVSIFSGAKIGPGVTVGSYSIIRENAVIGGWGFGIAQKKGCRSIRLPHIGGVSIGQYVEIGALSTVCSGTIDPTVIEDEVKINDHVHIAHNCKICKNAFVMACVDVSGSVTIGEASWIAPNSSIINGVSIGCNATVGIGAVIINNVEDSEVVVGNPGRIIRVKE